jgi:heme iron utilization protein
MPAAHTVTRDQRDELKDEFASIPPATPEPTHAERARTLMAASRVGSLATLSSVEPVGYPFGSVVSYALDDHGRPLLLLSDLAEHSRNLKGDPRASLMTKEDDRPGDVLALGRVTLVGDLHVVDGDDRTPVREAYLASHPNTVYADFADFNFYRLDLKSVRYVGGFGHMSWVTVADYMQAEADPLRADQNSIVEHMNEDHGEAMVAFARAFGGVPEAMGARMLGCDRYGFEMLVEHPGGKQAVRLGFGEPTDSANAVRQAMIRMVAEARAQLAGSEAQ